MERKFLYQYNVFKGWLGGLGWQTYGSKRIDPHAIMRGV